MKKSNTLYLKDNLGESAMVYKGNYTFTLEDDPVIFNFLDSNRIPIQEETWSDDFANKEN